ncbi:hypothetical protein [Sphingomonas aurantiaca]|uniref:hypothetical protein n=1 Tax=Sphingomonas aurantiaca TaxID=185949 RepID=UPI003364F7B3
MAAKSATIARTPASDMTLNYRNRDLDAVGRSKIDGIVHAHSGRRQPAQISASLHPPS